ncbi:MAG: hypothetical protein IJ986_05010 [Bacteroidales bacterium]|nr:hypothetical protein [Bacteroidales bacterium]
MRKIQLFATALLAMSVASTMQAQEKELTVTVKNTWKEAKSYEPIVLNLKDVNPGFDVQSATVMDGNTEIQN